jgi:polyphosphate kinase 2 (PPK2 family)
MQTVKNLNEENQHLKLQLEALTAVVEPIADVFEPRREGTMPRPLVDRLKDASGKLKAYLQRLRKSIPQQVIAFLRSYFPTAPVEAIVQGIASNCSNEKFQELLRSAEPVAAQVAEHISLK